MKKSVSPHGSWCSWANRCLQLPGDAKRPRALSRALFQSIGINARLFTVNLTVFGITRETHLRHVCEGVSRDV